MINQFISLTSGSLSRNRLRTAFLLFTIVGTLLAFMATEAATRELSSSAINVWNTQNYDLSIVGAGAFSMSPEIKDMVGVRDSENAYMIAAKVNRFSGDVFVVEDGHMLKLKWASGREPQTEGEIAVGSFVSKRDRLGIGSEIKVSGSDAKSNAIYIVSGIMENPASSCIITKEGLVRIEPSPEQYQTVLVARDAAIDPKKTKLAIEALASKKALKMNDPGESQYMVDSTVYTITSVTSLLVLASGMSSFLILLGLYQRDRSYELGVLRALGYSKVSVFLVLSLDSLILIAIGLLIGILGSIAGTYALNLGNVSTLLARNAGPVQNVGMAGLLLALIVSFRTSNLKLTRLLRVER